MLKTPITTEKIILKLRSLTPGTRDLSFVPISLYENLEVVQEMLRVNGLYLKEINDYQQAGKINKLWNYLKGKNYFHDDLNTVLIAVGQNGLALQYASEELKENEFVVRKAVSQNGLAIEFVKAKKERRLILAAVSQNPKAWKFLSLNWKTDIEIIKKALINNGTIWIELSLQVKKDEEILGLAIKNGLAWSVISEQYQTEQMAMLAIDYNLAQFRFLSKNFRTDNLIKRAVNKDPIMMLTLLNEEEKNNQVNSTFILEHLQDDLRLNTFTQFVKKWQAQDDIKHLRSYEYLKKIVSLVPKKDLLSFITFIYEVGLELLHDSIPMSFRALLEFFSDDEEKNAVCKLSVSKEQTLISHALSIYHNIPYVLESVAINYRLEHLTHQNFSSRLGQRIKGDPQLFLNILMTLSEKDQFIFLKHKVGEGEKQTVLEISLEYIELIMKHFRELQGKQSFLSDYFKIINFLYKEKPQPGLFNLYGLFTQANEASSLFDKITNETCLNVIKITLLEYMHQNSNAAFTKNLMLCLDMSQSKLFKLQQKWGVEINMSTKEQLSHQFEV